MNQYTVLLVDDEEDVIQVIMKKLDWEAMGFEIAGFAKNGVEALEMAEELQPDVVMTDIKMPYMDGLTLCRHLREMYQRVKIIIFSGFDEFEYAKEAIKIEAEEYILKPINANELREVFERIKISLDRELDEKRNIEKLKEYYMDSLPLLQENFYTSLLEGRIAADKIEQFAINYQIDLKGPYFVATVLHISNCGNEDGTLNQELLAVSVKKLAEEYLDHRWNSRVVTYLGELIILAQLEKKEDAVRLTDTMNILCKMAKRVCNATITAGVGYICDAPCELQFSYQGAKNAVSYRVLYGNTRAINIKEIEPKENTDIPWEESYIKNILKKIKMGQPGSLGDAIFAFVKQLSTAGVSLQKYRMLMMELLAELFRFGNDNQISMEKVFGTQNDIYSQALRLESVEELSDWLMECCKKMQQLILEERQDTTKNFVKRAIEYVRENYADKELGIENVCSYLNVSAAYFSTIFKKETGKTFINYLTDCRMQEAVELLMVKNEKTYIIADKVGYADPNYFSYVFKKQFGMSPSKYKTSRLGES